jgi:hypothetical protein
MWDEAVKQLYRTSPQAQQKGAPRGAFLGLCEDGLVLGIAPAPYSKSRDHKRYAVAAVALLRSAACPATVSALWPLVTAGADVAHNSQLDVVLALWKNGLIAPPE